MRREMMAIFHVVETPDGPDLQVGEEDDPSAVYITFYVPVSRVIDRTPELRELVSTLTRERDEARAEVERLRAVSAELQAAEKVIEMAGSLYQTRESLKDKIVCLIGQRSDLITQVLAHMRELDAAHARIRELEAILAEVERDSSRGHSSRVIRRLPPWIPLTKDPEPSPAPPEGGAEVERLRAVARLGEGE